MTIDQTNDSQDRRWWTLGVLCLSLVMIVLANTSLNVALPTLSDELNASDSALQWIVDAYALVFAGLLLTAGALGDRYGRKGALQAGLVIFGGASLVAAVAESATVLIVARSLMGVGAALVMPATLSVLAHVFPPQERARAIAIWAAFAGAGGAAGSLLGGWLLRHFWWGSIFLLNVAVAVAALIAGRVLVPRSREDTTARLDPVGAVLSTAGLAALLYAVIQAPEHGWTAAPTIAVAAGAVLVLAAFVAWELHRDDPMLDLRWFRNPRFTAATATITLTFFAMFGTIFVLTQYLQLVRGYDSLGAGIRILPWPVTYLIAAPRSARLVERFEPQRVIVGGLLLVATGFVVLTFASASTPYVVLALSMIVMAGGMAIVAAPSTGAIIAALPLDKAGVGSAVNDTTRELGGALGVAVLGSVVAARFQAAMPSGAPRTLGAAVDVPAFADQARNAYASAMGTAMAISVVACLAAAGLVAWLLRPAREVEPAVAIDDLELAEVA